MRDIAKWFGKWVRINGRVSEERCYGRLHSWLLCDITGDFALDHLWLIEKQLRSGSARPSRYMDAVIVVQGCVGAYLKYASRAGVPMSTDLELKNYRVVSWVETPPTLEELERRAAKAARDAAKKAAWKATRAAAHLAQHAASPTEIGGAMTA